MLSVINGEEVRAEMPVPLDELCRQGAQQMLAAAMEAEVADYVAGLAGEVDEHGHRLVRRSGRHEPRTITTRAGAVGIHHPRVDVTSPALMIAGSILKRVRSAGSSQD